MRSSANLQTSQRVLTLPKASSVLFLAWLNQRSLPPAAKVKQSSQLHAKKLNRKNKNKPNDYLLPKHHFFRYLCCHRSFPQDKNSAVNFSRQKKIATIADLLRQKITFRVIEGVSLKKVCKFSISKDIMLKM